MSATFVGMPAFPKAAHAALADTQLRTNLAHATGTIRDKRARVVAEVDNWEELRVAGASTKDDMLAHLDEHLVTLEESLTAPPPAHGDQRGCHRRRRRPPRPARLDATAYASVVLRPGEDLGEVHDPHPAVLARQQAADVH